MQRHRKPQPDASWRQTCTAPEAGSGRNPYRIGGGNVLEGGASFGQNLRETEALAYDSLDGERWTLEAADTASQGPTLQNWRTRRLRRARTKL